MKINNIKKTLLYLQSHPERTMYEKRIYIQEALNYIDNYEEYKNGNINKLNRSFSKKIEKYGEKWFSDLVLEYMTNLMKPMVEHFPNLPNSYRDSRIKITINFIDRFNNYFTLKGGRIKGVFPTKTEENCFYEFIKVPEVKKTLSYLYYDMCEHNTRDGVVLKTIEDDTKPKNIIELFQKSKTSKQQDRPLIGIDHPFFNIFFADMLFHMLKGTSMKVKISQ